MRKLDLWQVPISVQRYHRSFEFENCQRRDGHKQLAKLFATQRAGWRVVVVVIGQLGVQSQFRQSALRRPTRLYPDARAREKRQAGRATGENKLAKPLHVGRQVSSLKLVPTKVDTTTCEIWSRQWVNCPHYLSKGAIWPAGRRE